MKSLLCRCGSPGRQGLLGKMMLRFSVLPLLLPRRCTHPHLRGGVYNSSERVVRTTNTYIQTALCLITIAAIPFSTRPLPPRHLRSRPHPLHKLSLNEHSHWYTSGSDSAATDNIYYQESSLSPFYISYRNRQLSISTTYFSTPFKHHVYNL